MSKHTSGEWVVDESRHDGCINRLEPFRHIAMVSAYQSVKGDREENEANARLIAAAPALFKELQLVLDYEEQSQFEQWIERASPSCDCESVQSQWLESSEYEDFCDLWIGPIAAIAKALAQ